MMDIDQLEALAREARGTFDGAGLMSIDPATLIDLIAELRKLRDGEPNMRHPRIQHLISAKARLAIELSIIESLVTDPEYEMSPPDDDYWTSLCDKVHAAMKERR